MIAGFYKNNNKARSLYGDLALLLFFRVVHDLRIQQIDFLLKRCTEMRMEMIILAIGKNNKI